MKTLMVFHMPTDPISTDPGLATTVNCLTAGTVVGISITIFLVSFSVGVLLGALIIFCCMRSGQSHLSLSEGPVNTLEMKQNPSYGPVRH